MNSAKHTLGVRDNRELDMQTRAHPKYKEPSFGEGRASARPVCKEIACVVGLFFALGARTEQVEPLTIRVLPRVTVTNAEPLRLGFQMGLLEGSAGGLRAECFDEQAVAAGMRGLPDMTTERALDTGRSVYTFENRGDQPQGVTLTATTLRKGVTYTVRVTCRHLKGSGVLRFVFAPLNAKKGEETGERVTFRGVAVKEKSFSVKPRWDGDYRCGFLIEPRAKIEVHSFSMVPDDAASGWNREALTALRTIGAGVLRWPVMADGPIFYNWYDGVGPNALRHAARLGTGAKTRNDFGTVEFVAFCRLVGVEPQIRVPVFLPGCADAHVPDLAAGVQLAADWVAYCNATNDHALAELRRRHNHPEALNVKRWELAVPEGRTVPAQVLAETYRAYAAAMRAEDPSIQISDSRDRPFLVPLRDRYVEQVMRRLETCDAAEHAYYGGWYETLSVANAALARLQSVQNGAVCAPFFAEKVLNQVPYARTMLSESGLLLAVVNRFPALALLTVEGLSAEEDAPFKVLAAATEDPKTLVVFIYNSGAESRTVRLDLTELKRSFMFYLSDQLYANLTLPRNDVKVPVSHRQRAGAALTQVVLCECPPASFTRLVVKE